VPDSEQESLRPCPSCGSRTAEPLVSLPLALAEGHPLGDTCSFVSCLACGTGFADEALAQSDFDRHYAESAKYGDDGATNSDGPDTPWNIARQEITAERLCGLVPADASLLDIGCATGSLLVALAARGMTAAVGLDPSPRSAEVAAARGVTVFTGTFAELPPGLGEYDAITMNGVLEHLWDVDAALATVRSLLRPGGLIYVEVPDASRYCDPYVAPFQDFNTEHVNHFSPVTLDRLLRRSGFTRIWQGAADAELAAGFPAPTTAGSWQIGEKSASSVERRDDVLVRELHAFTVRSATEIAALDAALEIRLGDRRDFIGWGVGELAYKLLAMPALARRTVTALVDGNPGRRGVRIRGVEVGAPQDIAGRTEPVVVLSLLAADSIRQALIRSGLPNAVVDLDGVLAP
jgi:SAM-dependent methyltransferase